MSAAFGATMYAAGISHGALNASNVLVLDDGPMLVDFSAATLGAPQSALDMDNTPIERCVSNQCRCRFRR